MENGVTYIDVDAFHTCNNLKKMIIGDNVEVIKHAAFCYCYSLESLIIGDGVKEIPTLMCYCNYNLTYLHLGKNVSALGAGYLAECRKLKDVDISKENKNYIVLDGVVYNSEKNKIISCPSGISGEFKIKDDVVSIETGAFYGCSLITNVDFGKGVKIINTKAFKDCNGLTELIIDGNVTDIASDAFHTCSNLKKVKLESNVTNLLGACFCWCSKLEEVEIGNGVKSIGVNLFYGDSKLTEVTYNGSIDEWNKITKKSGWNANTKIQTIICKDGNIEL